MGRTFTEHHKRQLQSLNGFFGFCTDKEKKGLSLGWQGGIPSERKITVPQVWNSEVDLLTYTGVAWYEKRFFTEGGTLRFVFDGVMTECTVWLDGELLCSHYGGFTSFEKIVKNVNKGEHILVLRVDNSFDEHSIPQAYVDWYHYGGIVRGVSVETLSGICILRSHIEYSLDIKRETAKVKFSLDLYNADDKPLCDTITIAIDDKTISIPVTMNPHEALHLQSEEMELSDIRLWDIGKPELYTVTFESATDDLFDRTGFRTFEVKGHDILLNGRKIEIRGTNRHEEHPDFGFAFPLGLMQRDIDLIKAMGANAIRGSHYPNSKEFLDLVDENGLLFWSEIPIWGVGFRPELLADEVIIARGLEMHREMLEQYYNHPSIVIWGMHNEIATGTEYALPMSKLYYNFLKENGGNRAVVYACCHPLIDICFDYTDILCLNLYFGWYRGYEENAWENFFDTFDKRLLEIGQSHKPIIMSEFGFAALYGNHDADDILWSEEYQERMFEHVLTLYHSRENIAGFYIWQFADIRTSREAGLNRARSFNNKGVMNEHRKPKLAYRKIKSLYKMFEQEEQNL
jgi:beta-glucuronidase